MALLATDSDAERKSSPSCWLLAKLLWCGCTYTGFGRRAEHPAGSLTQGSCIKSHLHKAPSEYAASIHAHPSHGSGKSMSICPLFHNPFPYASCTSCGRAGLSCASLCPCSGGRDSDVKTEECLDDEKRGIRRDVSQDQISNQYQVGPKHRNCLCAPASIRTTFLRKEGS